MESLAISFGRMDRQLIVGFNGTWQESVSRALKGAKRLRPGPSQGRLGRWIWGGWHSGSVSWRGTSCPRQLVAMSRAQWVGKWCS